MHAQSQVVPRLRNGEEAVRWQPALPRPGANAALPKVHSCVLPESRQAPAAALGAACCTAAAAAACCNAAAAAPLAARTLLPRPRQRRTHSLLRAAARLGMLLLWSVVLLEGWAVAA